MKKLSIVVAIGFVLGLVGMVEAHVGELHYVFQFPDNLVPSIDGDISDWDIVPDAYWIHMEELIEHYYGNPVDLENCNLKQALGWNPTANRIYFAAWVYDDKSLPQGDDYFSLYFDPFHKGVGPDEIFPPEPEPPFAVVLKYYFMVYEYQLGVLFSHNPAGWAWTDPWANGAEKAISGTRGSGGAYEFTCEMYFAPWDYLDPVGPPDTEGSRSELGQLVEGEIMGAELAFRDADTPDVAGNYWEVFSGGADEWKDARLWGDWLLCPLEPQFVAVESSTWGQIKSLFK